MPLVSLTRRNSLSKKILCHSVFAYYFLKETIKDIPLVTESCSLHICGLIKFKFYMSYSKRSNSLSEICNNESGWKRVGE